MEKPPPYNDNYPGYPNYAPTAPLAPGFAPPVMVQPNVATTIQVSPQFGDRPTTVLCTNCQQQVVTSTQYERGALTYLCAFGLALFAWCGCCLIPCCCDSCKDVHHYCSNCNTQLGIYKRL